MYYNMNFHIRLSDILEDEDDIEHMQYFLSYYYPYVDNSFLKDCKGRNTAYVFNKIINEYIAES